MNSTYSATTQAENELLNSTVRSLAKATSDVLTAVYQQIYNDNETSVQLCTQPIAASPEVIALHQANLMPRAMATERGLQVLGASRPQIHAALQRVHAKAV